MDFNKFMNQLDEGTGVQNKKVLSEAGEENLTGEWAYVADLGKVVVAVEDMGGDKWQIWYFTPQASQGSVDVEMESKRPVDEIMKYQRLVEAVKETGPTVLAEATIEGDKAALAKASLLPAGSGQENPQKFSDFAGCLEQCVYLVENKGKLDAKTAMMKK